MTNKLSTVPTTMTHYISTTCQRPLCSAALCQDRVAVCVTHWSVPDRTVFGKYDRCCCVLGRYKGQRGSCENMGVFDSERGGSHPSFFETMIQVELPHSSYALHCCCKIVWSCQWANIDIHLSVQASQEASQKKDIQALQSADKRAIYWGKLPFIILIRTNIWPNDLLFYLQVRFLWCSFWTAVPSLTAKDYQPMVI